MSMDEFHHELRKNVKEFVENKLKDIQSVDEILTISRFSIEQPNIEIKMGSYDRLYKLKKILQVTINLYNNFDSYSNFTLKFMTEEINDWLPLMPFYKQDDTTHSWICNSRPMDTDVIEIMINYILCFKSIEMHEDSAKLMSDELITAIACCIFCDETLLVGNDSCTVCNTSLVDIQMFLITLERDINKEAKVNMTKRLNDDNTRYIQTNSVNDQLDVCVNDSLLICGNSKSNNNNDDELRDIYNNDIYNIVPAFGQHCVDCGGSIFNSLNQCDDCYGGYVEMKSRDNFEETAKWKCHVCKLWYPYDVAICDSCNCAMEKTGRWLCKSCTYENQFIYSRCDVCFTSNDHVVIKYCQMCKLARIGVHESFCRRCIIENNSQLDKGWWECKLESCCRRNEAKLDFCVNCGLWRYSFEYGHTRGGPLRRLKRGKESAVWICSLCGKFNNIDLAKCSSWFCRNKRYEKRSCNHCHQFSDGTSNVCPQCNTLLQ